MQSGKVIWFNAIKGYGFIKPADGGEDVFVHARAFERLEAHPSPDDRVEFEVETSPKNGRPQACRARLIESVG
jgi:CspA family cold shock protein